VSGSLLHVSARVADGSFRFNPRLDQQEFFQEPISATEVPDYYDVVKVPMDFAAITAKVQTSQYTSVAEFRVSFQFQIFSRILS
jgi:hypothetical protein